MPPIADFSCLSKKCRTAKGAPVYTLPVKAIACPTCGSRKIQRLWNQAPYVYASSARPKGLGGAGDRHTQRLIDTAAQEAQTLKDERSASETRLRKDATAFQLGSATLNVVPTRGVGGLAQIALQPGGSRPGGSVRTPFQGGTPIPGPDSKRDRSRVVVQKNPDGSGRVTAQVG